MIYYKENRDLEIDLKGYIVTYTTIWSLHLNHLRLQTNGDTDQSVQELADQHPFNNYSDWSEELDSDHDSSL